MRKKRSKNFDDKTIEEIVEILDKWGMEKLTWNLLIDAVALNCLQRYTRQALSGCERIRNAFDLTKEKQRSETPGVKKNMPHRLKIAYARIARLETENSRLKAENNALLVQFATWAYNANAKGLDIDF